MSAPDAVSLDPSTAPSGTIPVADYPDQSGKKHQAVVIETQSGTPGDDPQPVGAANPLPVSVANGTIPGATDAAGFNPGTTQGVDIMAVCNDSATLAQGQHGAPRQTINRQLVVAEGASTTDGWTPSNAVAPAVPVAAQLKNSKGKIGILAGTNTGGPSGNAWVYLKIFDSSGAPTLGTDTPKWNLGIPPNGGNNPPLPGGLQFNSGAWWIVTGGIGETDTTSIAANSVSVNFGSA